MPRDIADRAQSGSSDFAGALGDIIGHIEDLFSLFVEQQVIIAKVPEHEMKKKHVQL